METSVRYRPEEQAPDPFGPFLFSLAELRRVLDLMRHPVRWSCRRLLLKRIKLIR